MSRHADRGKQKHMLGKVHKTASPAVTMKPAQLCSANCLTPKEGKRLLEPKPPCTWIPLSRLLLLTASKTLHGVERKGQIVISAQSVVPPGDQTSFKSSSSDMLCLR